MAAGVYLGVARAWLGRPAPCSGAALASARRVVAESCELERDYNENN
jgi:hypothetical protein